MSQKQQPPRGSTTLSQLVVLLLLLVSVTKTAGSYELDEVAKTSISSETDPTKSDGDAAATSSDDANKDTTTGNGESATAAAAATLAAKVAHDLGIAAVGAMESASPAATNATEAGTGQQEATDAGESTPAQDIDRLEPGSSRAGGGIRLSKRIPWLTSFWGHHVRNNYDGKHGGFGIRLSNTSILLDPVSIFAIDDHRRAERQHYAIGKMEHMTRLEVDVFEGIARNLTNHEGTPDHHILLTYDDHFVNRFGHFYLFELRHHVDIYHPRLIKSWEWEHQELKELPVLEDDVKAPAVDCKMITYSIDPGSGHFDTYLHWHDDPLKVGGKRYLVEIPLKLINGTCAWDICEMQIDQPEDSSKHEIFNKYTDVGAPVVCGPKRKITYVVRDTPDESMFMGGDKPSFADSVIVNKIAAWSRWILKNVRYMDWDDRFWYPNTTDSDNNKKRGLGGRGRAPGAGKIIGGRAPGAGKTVGGSGRAPGASKAVGGRGRAPAASKPTGGPNKGKLAARPGKSH